MAEQAEIDVELIVAVPALRKSPRSCGRRAQGSPRLTQPASSTAISSPPTWCCGETAKVKILDFGLAKLIAHGESETSLTEAGAMLGTVAYMSPEQGRVS